MHPKAFKEKWGINNAQLAHLLGVGESTVERWFLSGGPNYREPPQPYLNYLELVDHNWTGLKTMPEHIKESYPDNLTE